MPRTSRITLVLGAIAVALVALVAVADGAEVEKTTVTLGADRRDAGSVLPRPALPGGRQRHRLPGLQRPDPEPVPGPDRRHDQVVDADPRPADRQPAHLLQRLLRHAARGAAGDPPPRPRHQPAALQPAPPGRGQGADPVPRADGQIRRLAEGRKGRHHRHHRADLGADVLPGTRGQQRLAGEPRAGRLHQLDRHPPGPAAGSRSANAPPTAASTRRPACSTPRPWSRKADARP